MLTESEKTFEEFCRDKGIPFEKIQGEENKTPDYYITLSDTKIVVEIKQFGPNYEEDLILDDLSKNLGKVHIKSVTPGKAVRRKIRKAATQIKKRTNGKLPSLLVFYNNRLLNNPANSYEIRVGMYGFDTIVLAVPNDMSVPPYEIDRKFGGKRQMTENCNTSITGVGVLVKDERGSLQLQVYHNIHAKIPLPHNVLKEAGIKQFTLEPKMQGESQGWTEIL